MKIKLNKFKIINLKSNLILVKKMKNLYNKP